MLQRLRTQLPAFSVFMCLYDLEANRDYTGRHQFPPCKKMGAVPSGLAVKGVDLRGFACWDCEFEYPRGHGCLGDVCCKLEVSATG
jgi:hypothetical protein